ncbi:PH domain-containing protein [Candidatus Nomurabacteria bacterium]|uniref:PH domain-containing protein n=1 Tax=candidate division WWE3 bacterium TaxID=2053526 RepID=A0A955E0E0_UNCKA|nr:PH domain-containing protein [candidate division WWE3 bacterium]MCB9823535.1 PH domain-containing protein [Candidatus Nomurabacteria bacterium]MCB9827330.1 PH domain-containing protein [Candidatus Nomurabacteria bacterium]HXK52486.1 PH domain-containing protein [bacterium]
MLKTLYCSFLEKPKNMGFEGEDRDEHILYLFRKSFLTNAGWITATIIMLTVPFLANSVLISLNSKNAGLIPVQFILVLNIFWFLFTFGFALTSFVNWFFNIYLISNKRMVDMDFVGILHKNISEAPLTSVEDTTSNVSGALRTVFNIGSVYIQTAAERREFEFIDVADPAKVRDLISDLVTEKKEAKDVH